MREAINWGFAQHPDAGRELIDDADLTLLAHDCGNKVMKAKEAGVSTIQQKLADVRNPALKLRSTLSEVHFAIQFAELGANVRMIPDNDSEWDGKSPDFEVRWADRRIFVEVTRLGSDYTDERIQQGLQDIVRARQLRVSINRDGPFAPPIVTYDEKAVRDELIKKLLEKVRSELEATRTEQLPVEVSFQGCTITVERSPGTKGYFSGGTTGVFFVPTESFEQQLGKVLPSKASKVEAWKDRHPTEPYLVAVDSAQMWLGVYPFRWLLYGSICQHPDTSGKSHKQLRSQLDTPVIRRALSRGWKSLLAEVGFDPSRKAIISEPGVFLANQDIYRGVTGVLARVQSLPQYFPNPFSERDDQALFELLPWGIDAPFGF